VFLTPTEHDLDQHLSDRWADTLQEEATMRTSAQVLTVVLLLSFAVPCFAKEAGKTQASSPAQTIAAHWRKSVEADEPRAEGQSSAVANDGPERLGSPQGWPQLADAGRAGESGPLMHTGAQVHSNGA
jgi:hypothetical protein